jgi:hypothetical protein
VGRTAVRRPTGCWLGESRRRLVGDCPIDADASTWSSWNRFPGEFAVDTGARVAKIDDGGIAGEAF